MIEPNPLARYLAFIILGESYHMLAQDAARGEKMTEAKLEEIERLAVNYVRRTAAKNPPPSGVTVAELGQALNAAAELAGAQFTAGRMQRLAAAAPNGTASGEVH